MPINHHHAHYEVKLAPSLTLDEADILGELIADRIIAAENVIEVISGLGEGEAARLEMLGRGVVGIMSGQEWSSDTLEAIAELARNLNITIEDLPDEEVEPAELLWQVDGQITVLTAPTEAEAVALAEQRFGEGQTVHLWARSGEDGS